MTTDFQTKELITPEQVAEAKAIYDQAKKRMSAAVENNSNAYHRFRASKTEENTEAYAQTRKEHAAALEHIKEVRHDYDVLKYDFSQQSK